jgi:hypothetical protein
MWKRLQSFDVQHLLLAHFEGSAEARKNWLEKIEWFIPTELDPKAQFSELIAGFHEVGRSMQAISCSDCRGLVVTSYNYYKYLTVTKRLVDAQQIMQIDDKEYEMYSVLFNCTDAINVEYPHITIADKLQCLENFNQIEPFTHKCGVMLAKCTCSNSYRKFCCVETIVLVCSSV